MRSNYKQRMREAKVPHVAFVKHNLRATVDERIQEHIDEYERRRREELEAYAKSLDETMLYALHTFPKTHMGRKLLREFWVYMYKTRLQARIFFRDGSSAYNEQETGKNIEDLGIRAELRKIGIDIGEWLMEEVSLTEEEAAALAPKDKEGIIHV